MSSDVKWLTEEEVSDFVRRWEASWYNAHDEVMCDIITAALKESIKVFKERFNREPDFHYLMDRGMYGVRNPRLIDESTKERGCPNDFGEHGGCGCMGVCREPVPATEVDRIDMRHYNQSKDRVIRCLEKLGYTNG